jgi:hypothetical protein
MTRRGRHILWLLFPLLCLLTVGVSAAITYWRHTVPLAETSEVYRQYRHQPGVRAAFIRQMPINDTLRLDMTLLEAEDSAAFAALLIKMGKSEEYIRDMATLRTMYEKMDNGYDIRFSGRCLRGSPSAPPDEDQTKNEVVSFFPVRKCVAVFHTSNETEIKTVLHLSYTDKIKINY